MQSKLINIINKYVNEDVNDLVLKKEKNKDFTGISKDAFNSVILQIACRQKYKNKFPTILQEKLFTFPNSLSGEQASSEIAAYYKSNIFEEYNTSVELTGGLGIDSIYFSKQSERHTYCEPDVKLHNIFTNNCKSLGLKNIKFINSAADEFLKNLDKHYDILYVDPSRRNENDNNSKSFLIEELNPNIISLQKYFPKIANKSIIKLSPMLDITAAIEQIESVTEVHIVSIDNDCKELLVVCDYKKNAEIDNVVFVGINFICDYKKIDKNIKSIIKQQQRFEYRSTNSKKMHYSASVEKFIFEPNSSLMKLGCWSELCSNFSISKLHQNSHLFTAQKTKKNFPGFIYEVVNVVSYDKEKILDVIEENSKVSIKSRNFPDDAEKIRKKLKLKDGNDYYLFCTTLMDNKPQVIITKKVV